MRRSSAKLRTTKGQSDSFFERSEGTHFLFFGGGVGSEGNSSSAKGARDVPVGSKTTCWIQEKRSVALSDAVLFEATPSPHKAQEGK